MPSVLRVQSIIKLTRYFQAKNPLERDGEMDIYVNRQKGRKRVKWIDREIKRYIRDRDLAYLLVLYEPLQRVPFKFTRPAIISAISVQKERISFLLLLLLLLLLLVLQTIIKLHNILYFFLPLLHAPLLFNCEKIFQALEWTIGY